MDDDRWKHKYFLENQIKLYKELYAENPSSERLGAIVKKLEESLRLENHSLTDDTKETE